MWYGIIHSEEYSIVVGVRVPHSYCIIIYTIFAKPGASCELSNRIEKIIILEKKTRVSDNLLVSTLATAMQNEMLAVATKYGISSLSLSRMK